MSESYQPPLELLQGIERLSTATPEGTRIGFGRHGEVPTNVLKGQRYQDQDGRWHTSQGRRFNGGYNPESLTLLGTRQAPELGTEMARCFRALGVTKVRLRSSKAPRAVETALLARGRTLLVPGIIISDIERRAGLGERNHGKLTGELIKETFAADPELHAASRDNRFRYPGTDAKGRPGESIDDISIRLVEEVYEAVTFAPYDPTAMTVDIFHGLAGQTLKRVLLTGTLTNEYQEMTIPNGSLCVLQFLGGRWTELTV